MKVGSACAPLLFALIIRSLGAYGIRSAFATRLLHRNLLPPEFNRRAERRGDDNACAGRHSSKIRAKARDRARDNANNAIATQCLGNVTPGIAQRVCARVNLVANTSAKRLLG